MSKGIDIPIDALITDMNNYLWLGKANQFYGRVYRNELNDVIQPLYYIGDEAVDALKDDRKDAQCFVDVQSTRKMFADVIEAECRICFMVSLSGLYPSLNRSEAVEQVMADVKDLLMSSQFEIIQMVSGVDAFADYKSPDTNLADMAGNHLFRFDLKLIYQNC